MKKAKAAAKPKRTIPDQVLGMLTPDELADAEKIAEQYGARPSPAKACPFCKHSYIKPCTDKTKESCPNYQHLRRKK